MAKPPIAVEGVALMYPATTAYKQWVWREIRKRGDSLQWLVDEMKRLARAELIAVGKYETITNGTLSQLLGPEDEVPPPSSSVLLPAINKALGIEPPPVCDPSDELSQFLDRFRSRWARITDREKRLLREVLSADE